MCSAKKGSTVEQWKREWVTENGNWVFPQYSNGPKAGSLSQMLALRMTKMKINLQKKY